MAQVRSDRPEAKGFLHVRANKGKQFYEARWRDSRGVQRRRRLGLAWVEQDEAGRWVRRKGRVRRGFLDERRAYPLMDEVILAYAEEESSRPVDERTMAPFTEVVAAWMHHLKTEKRVKPSTVSRYRRLLVVPEGRLSGRKARIMRAFATRPLAEITTAEARGFLARLDGESISARTVNIHRETMHAIFEFARREDTYGLDSNPFAGTAKRPVDGAKPIETFEPEEILAVTAAARAGLHRTPGKFERDRFSEETAAERRKTNEQDAAMIAIAAWTGLRLGELRALRWRDVDLAGGLLSVSRAFSAGVETSTKSRRSRSVPLADQAKAEFEGLRRRRRFTGREDFVFCLSDGRNMGDSAARERFVRAQEQAGVRVRRFHDLRHTFGSLAIRKFDIRAVKEMMGHASLTTTERYLHSKPRPGDSAKLTSIFAVEEHPEAL
jgi:integrase